MENTLAVQPGTTINGDWQPVVRQWAEARHAQAMAVTKDHSTFVKAKQEAVVLEMFSLSFVVHTGQSKEDMVAMLPRYYTAEGWADTLTRLVKAKYLRSYAERGTRWYEVNLG